MKPLQAALAVAFLAATAATGHTQGRQYYSDGKTINKWHYYPDRDCWGCFYKFKPDPNQDHYDYHIAYYYPTRGKYVYFYNPKAKKFWGRCPFQVDERHPYEILDYPDRREKLSAIDPGKFKPLIGVVVVIVAIQDGIEKRVKMTGPMPPIPGGDVDPEPMDVPPPPPG